jgi:hypothetical protein
LHLVDFRVNNLSEINAFNHGPVKFQKGAKNPTGHTVGNFPLDHCQKDIQRHYYPKDSYHLFEQDQQLHGDYHPYRARTTYPQPPPPPPPPPPRKRAENCDVSETANESLNRIQKQYIFNAAHEQKKGDGLGQVDTATMAQLGDGGMKIIRSNLLNGGKNDEQ